MCNKQYSYKFQTTTQKATSLLLAIIFLLSTITPTFATTPDIPISSPSSRASTSAEFEIASSSIEVRCTSGHILFQWETASENNVSGFKIHRRGADGNRFINTIHLTANGAGSKYVLIDSQFTIGESYHYSLYGYEENLFLSLATQYSLAEETVPSCLYLPILMR